MVLTAQPVIAISAQSPLHSSIHPPPACCTSLLQKTNGPTGETKGCPCVSGTSKPHSQTAITSPWVWEHIQHIVFGFAGVHLLGSPESLVLLPILLPLGLNFWERIRPGGLLLLRAAAIDSWCCRCCCLCWHSPADVSALGERVPEDRVLLLQQWPVSSATEQRAPYTPHASDIGYRCLCSYFVALLQLTQTIRNEWHHRSFHHCCHAM